MFTNLRTVLAFSWNDWGRTQSGYLVCRPP